MIRRISILSLAVLAVAGCTESEPTLMPDVTGHQLDVALSDIDRAGISEEIEILGGGVFGVVDESNWLVCEQLPEGGSEVTDAPRLTVDRECPNLSDKATEEAKPESDAATEPPVESKPEPSVEPEPSDEPAPKHTAEAEDVTLTPENSADLAALLALSDYCDASIAEFADSYRGQTIAFPGNIAAMGPHGNAKTRFDILVGAGDYSETSAPGPAFQFRDVNTTYDLHYVGDTPGTIGVGTNLDITAEVLEYEPNTCLFLLEPIATSFQ